MENSYIIFGVIIIFLGLLFFLYHKSAINKLKTRLKDIEEKLKSTTESKDQKIKKLNNKVNSLKHEDHKEKQEQEIKKEISLQTKRLTDINQELDQFLYRSSQDFRQPITTLKGLNSLASVALKDDFSRSLFEKVGHTASQIEKVLGKFTMLHDILSVTGKGHNIDFMKVISHAQNRLEERIERENPQITINIAYDIQKFKSFATIIEIIFYNLLENSLDFTNEIVHESAQIKIDVVQVEKDVQIQFADNGVGIQDSVQARVFEMYFRGNENSKGKGLGLYIAKKGVDILGGTIELKSKIGEGTTFILTLPNLKKD